MTFEALLAKLNFRSLAILCAFVCFSLALMWTFAPEAALVLAFLYVVRVPRPTRMGLTVVHAD